MAYRNQTYVAFASEDLHNYNMMRAWKANENIDFDFHNAHDKNVALDTSKPETIKTRLRERLQNTKQAVLLASDNARTKAADKDSFLAYEITLLLAYKIPIVIANLDGNRDLVTSRTPATLLNTQQTMMVTSFQPKIIQYALDDFVEKFRNGEYKEPQTLRYTESLYKRLGL
jgi:MTH538 TIR-like domain (DUF1863)